MEQTTQAPSYPQPKPHSPYILSFWLLPYLLVTLVLASGFVVAILGIRVLRPQVTRPDPFATFSSIFPGQPADTRRLEAQGYSCWLETLPTIADISQRCSRDLQTGPFSHICLTIWDGTIRRLDLTVRGDAMTIGDLIFLWGRPRIHQHDSWGHLAWPSSGDIDWTASYKGRCSMFLPVGSVMFSDIGRFEP